MYTQDERRSLLETMLSAIQRIKLGIQSAVHSYSTALLHITNMDWNNIDIILTYISKINILEASLSSEDIEEEIRVLGNEYNKAIHRLLGKDLRVEMIDHHKKKIAKEFILNDNYYIKLKQTEKFDVETHKEIVCKMLLVNDNINTNSDTTFLCHAYVKLLSELGNEKERNYASMIWNYEEESDRLERFSDYVGYLWIKEASNFEIEKSELIEIKQQKLLHDLADGYDEAIEYFIGKIERPTIIFDKT